ncbi:MAG: hypothetical protein E6356_07640 [Terrisporobacter othiniensis]|uniref:hypothetical protein n=1 Tax=Terrisporobacter petrolearius TaxID=1460447 RepID=UPI0022E6BBC3|nr:hypothetical protein [Terrisporobacter petrolearius]MDU4861077.1 hypothetical protein [Terrisporobacter othiniensis]MDU6994711.1 hypothetical protein [Terrisporobacter othiniensis]
MKKILALTLCFLLLFTNTSYGQPSNIKTAIHDLDTVNNRVNIMIKEITGDEPLNVNELTKDIKFCESILAANSKQISNAYSTETDIQLRRTYSTILYNISLYQLSLSSMLVYINDDSKTSYFIDTCANFRQGTISLDYLKTQNG